jgi:Zierdtviridae DNA helicase
MSGPVKLYKVGDRIHADIPYEDGKGPVDAKRVSGARWSKRNRVWTYPLSMHSCRDLRSVFGKRLRIHAGLADWARKAIEREQNQLDMRSATDATLRRVPKVAPALAAAMGSRTFQRVGARFIADGRTVLIGDEPGLGKTLETLAGVIEAGAKNVLVFAKKKAAETVWGAEIPRWLGDAAEVYIATGDLAKAKRDAVLVDYLTEIATGPEKIRFVVCNIEMARMKKGEPPKFPQLFSVDWDAIVIDESHKALIGKNVMSANITQTRYGFMQLPLKKGGLKIALSGTPTRGKTQNLWGTLNWLRPDLFTSYWRWVERYFDVDDDGYGKKIGDMLPEAEADFDRMLAPYFLRRTKGEVAKDMPPRQYGGTPLDPANAESTVGVWLDMEPAQEKHYHSVKADAEAMLESGSLTPNGHLAEACRMKQFAICDWDVEGYDGNDAPILVPRQPSNKYNWLVEFIEERRDAGLKVVVASQFTRVVNAFSTWLANDGIKSYVLTGETRERAVAANVAAFNDPADKVPVMLINTMAGGESINLDACCDDLVFLDETFTPDDQEQVENRIHRMSRIHQVRIWYVRSRDTIEEEICVKTGAREGAVKARLDGSRGVQFVRSLLEA